MRRRIATAALVAAGALGATMAPAQDKQAECAVQADMVMRVVESRAEGRDAPTTTSSVQGALSGEEAKYASVVPAVVEWVYTLPEDKLDESVGASWTEACLAQ
ncbi:hypothetical protein [Roseivivax isoporae]|uniref:DNA primase n=1 Tax=Roseivivax isoporae LMG 25204 TaxID=1449351 RepID=X7F3I8_9RHOB|nr:hypothetical protein [Roseivivax isoporae]ETX27375.1 hypothetical protein RISW2_14360 [Roseivivax isoporae LMG 25204]